MQRAKFSLFLHQLNDTVVSQRMIKRFDYPKFLGQIAVPSRGGLSRSTHSVSLIYFHQVLRVLFQ